MIHFENIYKRFENNKVLTGIDIAFNDPGITAILGPNGSGKTTMIKCLLGLVIPDKGNIYYRNKSVLGAFDYRRYISYLPQIARFPENLTTLEIIRMIKDLRPGQTNEKYFIDMFDLDAELTKKMAALSGGNRQKINLMLALMYDNPVLILDEPSTGLDPIALINLKNYLRKEKENGKCILITTHIVNFVEEMADNIVFLLEGQIYFKGSLSRLITSHGGENLEQSIARILKSHKNHNKYVENI